VLLALGLPLLSTARREPAPEPQKESAFASEAV
jgi:hypothetical protein